MKSFRFKQAIRQGELNAEFEIHFDVLLKAKAKITPRLCQAWRDKSAEAIMGGERRNQELARLFNEHFPIDLGRGAFDESKNIWELWEKWEEIRKVDPFGERFADTQPPC